MDSTYTHPAQGTRPMWVPQQPTYQYARPVPPATYPPLPPPAVYSPLLPTTVYPPLPSTGSTPRTLSYAPGQPRRSSRLAALIAAGIVAVTSGSVAVAVTHGHSAGSPSISDGAQPRAAG